MTRTGSSAAILALITPPALGVLIRADGDIRAG
jgi:hypothetical protein